MNTKNLFFYGLWFFGGLVLAGFGLTPYCYSQSTLTTTNGRLVVNVAEYSLFDPQSEDVGLEDGDDIQPYRIFVRSRNRFVETVYKSGKFELNVQKGLYDLVLRTIGGRDLNYKRANIYVHSGEIVKINIGRIEGDKQVCDQKLGFVAEPLKHNSQPSKYPPIKYDIFLVKSPFKMVIQYCEKTIRKGTVSYKFALMTYRNITIYADRVTFKPKSSVFAGSGKVAGKVDTKEDNCLKNGRNITMSLNKRATSEFVCSDLRVR